jgi:hypothetical protein
VTNEGRARSKLCCVEGCVVWYVEWFPSFGAHAVHVVKTCFGDLMVRGRGTITREEKTQSLRLGDEARTASVVKDVWNSRLVNDMHRHD